MKTIEIDFADYAMMTDAEIESSLKELIYKQPEIWGNPADVTEKYQYNKRTLRVTIERSDD